MKFCNKKSCPVPSIGLIKLSMRPIRCVKYVKRKCLALENIVLFKNQITPLDYSLKLFCLLASLFPFFIVF